MFDTQRLTNLLPTTMRNRLDPYLEALGVFMEVRDPMVLASLGPAGVRGLLLRRAKQGTPTHSPAHHSAHFDWTYPDDHAGMRDLYERAKRGQWVSEQLPWHTDVDPLNPEVPLLPDHFLDLQGMQSLGVHLTADEQMMMKHNVCAWMLSQFLHGEQGALFASAQVTEAVQFFDGKLYGATQVMDEGRHVEVFHRYLDTKLGKLYQINDNLFVIIDALMTDARWDMKFLGMQIMVEGLALAAFGMIRNNTQEPLLRELTAYVIGDEARHVAFGVLSLDNVFRQMPANELRDREDFVIESSRLMRDRFLAPEVWARLGLPVEECCAYALECPLMQQFRCMLFSKIVPNLKRLGLLTDRVRPALQDLGVLEFEHVDPDLELSLLSEAPPDFADAAE